MSNVKEMAVDDLLSQLGMSKMYIGYEYCRIALLKSLEEPLLIHNVINYLYPSIAKKFDKSPNNIQANISYAIKMTWNNMSPHSKKVVEKIFGREGTKKPSNRLFIATLTDYIAIHRLSGTA